MTICAATSKSTGLRCTQWASAREFCHYHAAVNLGRIEETKRPPGDWWWHPVEVKEPK